MPLKLFVTNKSFSLRKKRITLFILQFLFSGWISESIAQQFADIKFYLIDSLDLKNTSDFDLQLIDSSLVLFHKETNDTLKIGYVNNIVESSWDDNIWPKYNNWIYHHVQLEIKKVKSEKLRKTYERILASCLSNIGFYYYQKGEFEPALKNYNEALKIQNTLGDKQGKASSYNNLGLVYEMKGDVETALDYYSKSLQLKTEISDKDGMALAYNNIAHIHLDLGNIPEALKYHQKSLKIREQTGNKKGMGESFVNIASIHSKQKNYDVAVKYNLKALKLFKSINDKISIATIYSNLGLIYKAKQDYNKALDYYFKGLKLDEEIDNKLGMIDDYYKISSIYYQKKDLRKSEEYILKDLALSEQTGYQRGLAMSYQLLSRINFDIGKIQEAKSFAEKGLQLATELGFPMEIKLNAEQLHLIYTQLGEYKKALQMRNLEIQMKDSLASEEAFRAAAEQEANYNYQKKRAQDSITNAQEKQISDAKSAEQDAIAQKQNAELKNKKIQQYALIIGLALLGGFLFVVYNRFRVTRSQKEIIEKQKEVVDEKNKEILDSIRYAKRIQEAILPSIGSFKKELKNSFLLYRPKDVVAGDFYWMERSGSKIYFAAADCTGHGVPGAMVSVVCSNALSKALIEEKAASTGNLLDKTREIVIDRLAKSGEEVRDGMDISVCAIDFNSMELQWSGANNPLWIIRSSENKAIINEIKPDKQPIGKHIDQAPFTTHNLKLESGNTIYIFTDGYQDQFGGPNSKKLKASNLKKTLQSIQSLSMSEQKNILEKEFDKWKGNHEQIDDVCIIGIRV